MRSSLIILILLVFHPSKGQVFLLSEGGGNNGALLDPVFTLRASFNDGKLWPSVKLAKGYVLTDNKFEELRRKYVTYFPDDKLIESLMLSTGPIDRTFVKWTLGTINPDKTITIHGQLIVKYRGVDPALDKPLIADIQLKSPSDVQKPDAQTIQEMYAVELEKRKNLPKPPPPPLPEH